MTYTEINKMMSEAVKDYKDYGKHELLVNLSCVYEDEHDDSEIEVIFAVPVKLVWLYVQVNTGWEQLSEKAKNGWKDVNYERVKDFLDNTYTSEDSQQILEKAILENEIAFYVIR